MPGTVTVAAKLPHGLCMRVFDFREGSEPIMGGGSRQVKVAVETRKRVYINGNSHPQNAAPNAPIIGGNFGYALTTGVDKDFWDKWLEQNKESDMVRNNLIFAMDSQKSVEDKAKDGVKHYKSGLERLNPHKLPSTRVETDKEVMKNSSLMK